VFSAAGTGTLEWHYGHGRKRLHPEKRGVGGNPCPRIAQNRTPTLKKRLPGGKDSTMASLQGAAESRWRRARRDPGRLQLEVERITLEVDDLGAHVSVLAELANLVSLPVRADVQLGRVKLEIEGVKAKALLEVRLEHDRRSDVALIEQQITLLASVHRVT
jgi:hypothetical protein